MKIVRVIARLNVGGPAKHVVWLTHGLQAPEYESLLIAGTVPPGEEDMSFFAAEMGVNPILIPEMSRELSLGDLSAIWKLYKLLLREKPDIVHTHTAKAGTVGRVAGWCYRWLTPATLIGRPRVCSFVHTYHGHIFHSYYSSFRTRLFLLIERLLARLATDRVVVVSQQQRREISEEFKVGRANQFQVIPLGLDLSVFSGSQDRRDVMRRELGFSEADVVVGIVGRLTEIKNHEMFLAAVSEYKQRSKSTTPAHFVIIGDGHLRVELERQTQELGIDDLVKFLGARRDAEHFYPALDIVALTSLNEGTPLTLIEAMANARPVIATAVGGVVDLLGDVVEKDPAGFSIHQRGLSAAANDVTAFAAGLKRLVVDDQLRREIGDRGLQFVTDHYSKERLLSDIKALYGDLVRHRVVPVTNTETDARVTSRAVR